MIHWLNDLGPKSLKNRFYSVFLTRLYGSLKCCMHLMSHRECLTVFSGLSNISQKYGSQICCKFCGGTFKVSCFVYKSLALIILEKVSERVSRSIWPVYYSLMKKTRCVCLVGGARWLVNAVEMPSTARFNWTESDQDV